METSRWAVNTCKYWQGWPQAKRATAHLDLNHFSEMTNLPLHCLLSHEHALQECPLTTSKTGCSAYTLRKQTWTLPEPWEYSSSPALKHIHLPLPVRLSCSLSLSYTHTPKYDLSVVKSNIYHNVMAHYASYYNHKYVISLQPRK